jgi:hypothetical protein
VKKDNENESDDKSKTRRARAKEMIQCQGRHQRRTRHRVKVMQFIYNAVFSLRLLFSLVFLHEFHVDFETLCMSLSRCLRKKLMKSITFRAHSQQSDK